MAGFNDEKKVKDEGPLTKHGWSVRRIRNTCIWAAASIVSAAAWTRVRYVYKGDPNKPLNEAYHYPYQLCCVVLAICILGLFINLRKIVPNHVKAYIRNKIYNFVKKYIAEPLQKFNDKVRKFLGLPEKQRLGGDDESSFIFDFEGNNLFRKFQSVKSQLRWKDLETNAEKIRFLFIKYFVKLIKSGYKYKAIKTPDEVRAELKLKDEPEQLFILYTGARYSGGRYNITDENVEMAEKLVKKR